MGRTPLTILIIIKQHKVQLLLNNTRFKCLISPDFLRFEFPSGPAACSHKTRDNSEKT